MLHKKLKRFGHLEPSIAPESCVFLNYTPDHLDKYPLRKFIQIAAFDPGIINTGCRVERRLLTENRDGFSNVETLLQKKLELGSKKDVEHYYVKLKNILLENKELFDNCDYILVESQLSRNPEAMRMAQHVISTLLCITSRPLIVEVIPQLKTRFFDIKKHKGLDIKKWSIIKAFSILDERNDTFCKDILKHDKKRDDHSDTILYCEAWGNLLLNNN